MFERIEAARGFTFDFEGRPVAAHDGDSVAAALLAAGILAVGQRPATGAPRGPYCMMGVCFDCTVEIDGVAGQACLVPAEAGLRVRRLDAARRLP